MTEAELWHMQLLAVANATEAFEGVLTIIFAYLATAYFVGRRLSRLQAALATLFFVIGASCASLMAMVEFKRAAMFMEQLGRFGVESISPNALIIPTFEILLVLFIAAAVFFMYQNRRSGRGAPDETPVDHGGASTP